MSIVQRFFGRLPARMIAGSLAGSAIVVTALAGTWSDVAPHGQTSDRVPPDQSTKGFAPLGNSKNGSGLPDLIVVAIDRSGLVSDWQALTISGPLSATVQNIGSAAAGSFSVTFFEDENGNGSFDPGTDETLGSTSVAGLSATASVTAAASVTGTLRFRDALIYAFVDSGGSVTELDETNNLRNTGQACAFDPPPGTFEPEVQWQWPGTQSIEPAGWLNVTMTPATIDLNLDGFPEVIFASTNDTGGGDPPGVLRAVDGRNGIEQWVLAPTDSRYYVRCAMSATVGNIDSDPNPEIIVGGHNGRLLCLEHDGTPKASWTQLAGVPGFGAVCTVSGYSSFALADLDGDGSPEIINGRQVFRSSDGTLLWTGAGGAGRAANSYAADVDVDGFLDVVAGNTVYFGQTRPGFWTAGAIKYSAAIGDGYTAVGNFDADPQAEIVVVNGGFVWLTEHNLTVKPSWPKTIPGGGAGGAPTIANYDSDPEREIGVAGALRYVVWNPDGSEVWQSVISNTSSNVTGSSVFDFEGDGSAEVVYRDQTQLRVYRGTDGFVLWSAPVSSCTWSEYVYVADCDGDANAEIIAVANNNCGFGPQQGVYVFRDRFDNWVPTRRLWNQYSYSITHILDDGSIPASIQPNWLFPAGNPYNNFRQNVLTTAVGTTIPAPDLTAAQIEYACSADQTQISARIGNGGSIFVASGIPVSFFNGDPLSGGTLLGTVTTTTTLNPNQFETVTLTLPGAFSTTNSIFVRADDLGTGAGGVIAGTENECDETNNTHSARFPAARSVRIDIYPNRLPNPVILSRDYTIYVVVFGAADFDVADVLPANLRFGRLGTEAAAVRSAPVLLDFDGDGFGDAMWGFETSECGFALGDTVGVLTGLDTACVRFRGEDSVLVNP